MTPDQLDGSCRILFGNQWKTPLAAYLGVRRETVSRWAGGSPIPLYAQRVVTLLIQSKGAVLSLCDRTGIMVRP